MSETEIDDLRAELDRLRAENAALRSLAPATETDPAPRRRKASWRAFVSAFLIIVAGVLVPVSIVASWARVELVDEEAFVRTFAPLADDPGVQQVVIDRSSTAIITAIDVKKVTNDLFDGIETLDLPSQARSALDLLREPAVSGVESLISTAVTRVVQSEAFSGVWQQALVLSHRSLVAVANADGSGVVVVDAKGELGIQLGPIIEQIKKTLVEQGFGLAQSIPAIDATVVIAQSDALTLVGTTYSVAVALGFWLPVIALVLFVAGVLVARRRPTAVLGAGVSIAIGAGALAAALGGAAVVLGLNAGALGIPAPTLDTIYFAVVGSMRDTAIVFTVLGLIIAASAWIGGGSRHAASIRATSLSIAASARTWLQLRGVDTGRVGVWLYQQRVLIRLIILVLAIVVLFALRPLSLGDVGVTVILALTLWLVIALLQRGPEATAAAEPADDVDVEPAGDGDPDVVETIVLVQDAPQRK